MRAFVALLADVLRMSLLRIYVANLLPPLSCTAFPNGAYAFLCASISTRSSWAALVLAAVGLWRAPLCARQEGLNHPEYAFVSFS